MLRVPSEIKAHQFESLKIQDNTFVAYRSDVYPSKNDVFFEENAVIYVVEGDKVFGGSNNEEVKVKKGDVLFVKRGLYLMTESTNESYKSIVFFFDEKNLKEFVAQHLSLFEKRKDTFQDQWLLKLESSEAFGKYIESLLPYFKSKTEYLPYFLKLKIQEMLLHLLEFDKGNQLKSLLFQLYKGQKPHLDTIVNQYFLKPLSLEELARVSGRSLSVFKREFQAVYGSSPGIYLKNKKLEHAQFLLKNKLGSVAFVSEAVGYESVSHFIRVYKEKFGDTPYHSIDPLHT